MQKKFGHTDHAMHRRSNFVTHGGQKIGFCFVSFFRRASSFFKVRSSLSDFGLKLSLSL